MGVTGLDIRLSLCLLLWQSGLQPVGQMEATERLGLGNGRILSGGEQQLAAQGRVDGGGVSVPGIRGPRSVPKSHFDTSKILRGT